VGHGDGSATSFQLDHYPVITAVTAVEILVNGTAFASGAGSTASTYVLDQSAGVLTFVTAPADSANIVARRYAYVTFEDEVLSGFLTSEDNIYFAAARALDSVLADNKHFFDYSQGSVKVEKGDLVKNMIAMAKHFREEGRSFQDRDFGVKQAFLGEPSGTEYEGYDSAVASMSTE